MFEPINAVQDVPEHLTLADFGPQLLLFELDSTIFAPNHRLLKLLRHSYLEHAPVLKTVLQNFDLLPPKLKASVYDNGPITCTHHIATLCLQNNHHRRAHLRQLAHMRYNNFTPSEHNTNEDPRETQLFTGPAKLVGPFQLPAQQVA